MAELSYELPEAGEARANSDVKIRAGLVKIKESVNGKLGSSNLEAAAEITRAQLNKEAKPVTWYTPKIIATEESRTNTAFGTLTTADEIKEIVLPTNGLIMVGYRAHLKASASNGIAALFLGANEVKPFNGSAVEVGTNITEASFRVFNFAGNGFTSEADTGSGDATTGQFAFTGSPVFLFAAAGTYTVSVKFKSASGSITGKERKLWVATLGF